MTGKQKTEVAAMGIILFALANTLILLGLTETAKVGPHALKLAVAVILGLSLMRRATWARWLVGVLSAIGAAMILLIPLNWEVMKPVMFSWVGIWTVAMAVFYGWVAFTLLIDRNVAAHFISAKASPTASLP